MKAITASVECWHDLRAISREGNSEPAIRRDMSTEALEFISTIDLHWETLGLYSAIETLVEYYDPTARENDHDGAFLCDDKLFWAVLRLWGTPVVRLCISSADLRSRVRTWKGFKGLREFADGREFWEREIIDGSYSFFVGIVVMDRAGFFSWERAERIHRSLSLVARDDVTLEDAVQRTLELTSDVVRRDFSQNNRLELPNSAVMSSGMMNHWLALGFPWQAPKGFDLSRVVAFRQEDTPPVFGKIDIDYLLSYES